MDRKKQQVSPLHCALRTHGTPGQEEGGVFVSAYLATTLYGSVTLPFVIPKRSRGICGAPRLPHKGLGLLVLTQTL
jgi:hypothetical protein